MTTACWVKKRCKCMPASVQLRSSPHSIPRIIHQLLATLGPLDPTFTIQHLNDVCNPIASLVFHSAQTAPTTIGRASSDHAPAAAHLTNLLLETLPLHLQDPQLAPPPIAVTRPPAPPSDSYTGRPMGALSRGPRSSLRSWSSSMPPGACCSSPTNKSRLFGLAWEGIKWFWRLGFAELSRQQLCQPLAFAEVHGFYNCPCCSTLTVWSPLVPVLHYQFAVHCLLCRAPGGVVDSYASHFLGHLWFWIV